MLRFAVYDDHGPAAECPLVNAHLLGPEDIPVRGDVAFQNGVITCRKRSSQTAALCLQYDAGAMGTLMLQTCLLPDRDEPYSLTLELARHRIKMFIAKSEEWTLFDLSAEHPAMRLWEDARRLMTNAWTNADPIKAERAARKSLIHAIDATERLALAHADILLHRRFAQRAASSSTLGVRVWPVREGKGLRELVEKEFDVLSIPLVWRELEVSEGEYRWDPIDRWMEWATKQGKPVLAGPLIDFSKRAVPDWIYVWQNDYDTCRDLVYDYIERVVDRYRLHVGMWNIASGLHTNENFAFSPEQMLDLTRMAALHVRQARKGARAMIELTQPFGEHAASHRDSVFPVTFVERLLQEGVRLDAIGVQLMLGRRSHGMAARDLMQVSSLLDRFFLLETPIIVSAMGVPSQTIDPQGGCWHESAWSPELQARWISRMFGICLSKPFVESLFWSELFDHPNAQLPASGLISESGQPKQALKRLIGLRRHLRKPLGPLKLPGKLSVVADDGERSGDRTRDRAQAHRAGD